MSLLLLLRQPTVGVPPEPPPPPPAQALPRTVAEMGFHSWDDVYPWLRSFTYSRGRSRERERMGSGAGTWVLDNREGTFDRDNPASPFYPNIRPARPARLSVRLDTRVGAFRMGRSALGRAAIGAGTQTVTLFTGRSEGGPMAFVAGADSFVTWSMVDASKRLNRDRSATGYGTGDALTGTRVQEVLLGTTPVWQDGMVVDEGIRTVQQETGALGRYDYLLQVAESEGGFFFIDAYGRAVFRDADYAADVDPIPFGDGPGEQPYKDITFEDDDKEIFNAVTVTARDRVDQTIEDAESMVEQGRIDLPISSLLANESEMNDLAASVVSTYAEPRRRISSMVIGSRSTDWYRVLSKEVGDRVRVRHRPMYGGMFEQVLVIQGISVSSPSRFEWNITWNLAPPLEVVYNPNLLTDNSSSMETDESGWGKTSGDNPPGNGMYVEGRASGTVPYLGSWCLELRSFGIPQILGTFTTMPFETAPVVPGETYRATGYVRSFWASIYAYIIIDWRAASGAVIGDTGTFSPFGPYFAGTSEWVQGTVDGIAPAGAVYATVSFTLVENDGTHPSYIDAVTLRHVGA